MKIAIHHRRNSFSEKWVNYCKEKAIDHIVVNCYDDDIMEQLRDCDALMWHFSHADYRDMLIARPLLFSLQQAGKRVFPDFNTCWHFDDKAGQKYLFEAFNVPAVPTHVFVEKKPALEWIKTAGFPKVFKLRGGAGASNVRLVRARRKARRLIGKAFSSGFRHTDYWGLIKDSARKYFKGRAQLRDIAKYAALLIFPAKYKSNMEPREKGYAYFQDFIPGNDSDIRIIVIGGKAFAIKRLVRDLDFRASGSGYILYDKNLFDPRTLSLAFSIAEKVQSNCVAFDFVYDEQKNPLVVEISYGFSPRGYKACPGYWTRDLRWHEGTFDPYGWMVDSVIE